MLVHKLLAPGDWLAASGSLHPAVLHPDAFEITRVSTY